MLILWSYFSGRINVHVVIELHAFSSQEANSWEFCPIYG
jgi:hypothetical protein